MRKQVTLSPQAKQRAIAELKQGKREELYNTLAKLSDMFADGKSAA